MLTKNIVQQFMQKSYDNIMKSNCSLKIKEAATTAFDNVKVEFSNRLRTTAGLAKCRYDRVPGCQPKIINPLIQLSVFILSKVDDKELFETISHEFAHIVDYYYRYTSNHDSTWKYIHQCCGGTGKRTHNLTVKKNNVTRYVIKDVNTDREYRITKQKWARLNYIKQYQLIRIDTYQGKQLVASQSVAQ